MFLINKFKLKRLVKMGLTLGENVKIEKGVMIDASFPWLIEIGNNVTIAPNVHILSHDASTHPLTGYTKLGRVEVGNNVFIGARSVILPNVKIGDNVIVGAGSVVTKNIPNNSLVVGVPAKVIKNTSDFITSRELERQDTITFDKSYTKGGKICSSKKNEMNVKLIENNNVGYIV